MNSFLYESLDSSNKSSYTVEPNSENNDKLHQQLMYIANKEQYFEDYNRENDEDDYEMNKVKTSSNQRQKVYKKFVK